MKQFPKLALADAITVLVTAPAITIDPDMKAYVRHAAGTLASRFTEYDDAHVQKLVSSIGDAESTYHEVLRDALSLAEFPFAALGQVA